MGGSIGNSGWLGRIAVCLLTAFAFCLHILPRPYWLAIALCSRGERFALAWPEPFVFCASPAPVMLTQAVSSSLLLLRSRAISSSTATGPSSFRSCLFEFVAIYFDYFFAIILLFFSFNLLTFSAIPTCNSVFSTLYSRSEYRVFCTMLPPDFSSKRCK